MSKMIPQATVNVMRNFLDISVDLYGIDCVLYIPNNISTVVNYDIYAKPADYSYDTYNTQVWIQWTPNKHRLRRLGLFLEDETPILAWFKNVINGQNIDITISSWFKIDTQYVPDKYDTEEFEIVDIIIPGMHDAVITKFYKIAPRRVKK